MQPELRPLAKRVSLEQRTIGDRVVHTGKVGDIELVATITTMGTTPAKAAAEFIVDQDVEHLVLIGIAGGLGADVKIGDLVVPEVVVDFDTGRETHPRPLGGETPKGKLMTSGVLIVDQDVLRGLADNGATAIDMETSAIGAVAESAGLPWSAYRGISDHIRDGLIDNGVLGLANADGSANAGAIAKYVAARPWRVRTLAKLGRDMSLAANAAADALVRGLR
jgi:nucleoside phosphorylase